METANKTLCDPCSNEDIHVPATHFCKTCDDPEPLCESCAKHHIRQKICRNHQICENIQEFMQKDQKFWYLFMFSIMNRQFTSLNPNDIPITQSDIPNEPQ